LSPVYPPTADIEPQDRHVPFVPKGDHGRGQTAGLNPRVLSDLAVLLIEFRKLYGVPQVTTLSRRDAIAQFLDNWRSRRTLSQATLALRLLSDAENRT
jgi:hypothetical protein